MGLFNSRASVFQVFCLFTWKAATFAQRLSFSFLSAFRAAVKRTTNPNKNLG